MGGEFSVADVAVGSYLNYVPIFFPQADLSAHAGGSEFYSLLVPPGLILHRSLRSTVRTPDVYRQGSSAAFFREAYNDAPFNGAQ